MKTQIIGMIAATAISMGVSGAAMAEEAAESWIPGSFTGNVALTSDYVFRGISQSFNGVAIQGGMDWDTGAGFHFGVWGSSINFQDAFVTGRTEATTEVDLYGGYAGKIGDALSYDVGGIYYAYPGAAGLLNYDYFEVYGKVTYDFGVAALGFGVNWSPDNTGATGSATYFSSSLSVPITSILSVTGGLDYQMLDQSNTPTAAFFPDYWDWNAGAKLNVNGWFNVDARYYDTDIPKASCKLAGRTLCGSKGVLTLSRSF